VIGPLLAFTDPVSIGDLLKKTAGIPKKFALLLEAESHLTDGTVFVLFEIALHSVLHGTFSWSAAIKLFFRLSFGGPALGIAFAIPIVFWLNKVSMDLTLGVIITIFGAY